MFSSQSHTNTCKIPEVVKLSQTREKFSTKDPRGFPPYIHTIQRTCEKQASRKTNVHKCINHMYTCIYTHIHACMHTQAHKSLFFRSCILSCQNGWPYLWGVRPLLRLPQTEPIQSRAGGREEELLMTDERWKLIPICGEGKTL